jgi:hypothetical protein
MPDLQRIEVPPGVVCVTTYGVITQQTAQCLMEARSLTERNGADNISWVLEPAALVERARNAAVRSMRAANASWLCFIDGDATFPPDAILRMLQTAYLDMPHADCVGAYMPLRGELALPTIDTGTGTWESWFPGSGTIEVIRTGAAFLFIKRHVIEALTDPWFRVRVPARPLDFMLEVDNWARIKFDGRNPFRELPGEPWEKLERCAKDDPSVAPEQFTPLEVGEDSGFCDRVRAAGFHIFVNTDISCGHVDQLIRTGADHRRAIDERDRSQRLLAGILQ